MLKLVPLALMAVVSNHETEEARNARVDAKVMPGVPDDANYEMN
jgi:hypothetical protein